MKKIIIATHHKLANGFKETLNYILPNTVEVIDICAYLENISIESQIDKVLSDFKKDEQIFVFTDIKGGSVNQEFTKKIGEYNIELISGVNLAIIISIALQLGEENIGIDTIREEVINSSKELVYINDIIKNQSIDDGDE